MVNNLLLVRLQNVLENDFFPLLEGNIVIVVLLGYV